MNWRPVKNYESLYLVSECGYIKSLEKRWRTGRGNGRLHIQTEVIKSQHVTRFGYLRVALWKEGKQKKYHVHRLVAMAFLPNYFEGAQVNHKDGNKTNNHASNLEFVTASENQKHAFATGLSKISEYTKLRLSQTHKGCNNHRSKKVIDTSNGYIYETIKDAAIANNISEWNLYAYLRGVNKNKTTLRYA